MKAWLVTNEFLNTNKYTELNQYLIKAAEQVGIQLLVKSNANLLVTIGQGGVIERMIEEEHPAFVLFQDKDIRLAEYLESLSLRVFNSAKAIEICDNKAMTHIVLNRYKIVMPKTILAPMTYENIGYTNFSFVKEAETQLSYPMIIKECYGSFGQQVYMVRDHEEAVACIKRIGGKPFLFQQFIQSSFARDLRLHVVGDQVVAAMFRYADDGDFRANISNGGKMKQYLPTRQQKEVAVATVKAIGLDFAGVDLLFDEFDGPIVCEVNSNAHFKNIYDCTGVNVAEKMIAYIVSKIKLNP